MVECSCHSAVTTAIAATIMVWSWPWIAIRAALERLGNASSEGRNLVPAGSSEADGHLYFSAGTTEGARSWQDGEGVPGRADLVHGQDPRVSLLHPTGSSWMRMILISGSSHLCHSRHPAGDAPAIGAEEGRKCLPAQSRQFGRHRHRYCGASSGTRRNHHRPVAYPVRDAMVVAYQGARRACSGESYVSGIGALADRSRPSTIHGLVCSDGR